jgi:uncharacterized protein YdhG (YjbR/CyaY superfamily)
VLRRVKILRMAATPGSVDEYIASFPVEARSGLERIRALIRQTAPQVVEEIRDGMPAMLLEGRDAVYIAGWKKHVGVYPVPKAPSSLERELEPYRGENDAVRFPVKKPIDWELVEELIRFLVRPAQ